MAPGKSQRENKPLPITILQQGIDTLVLSIFGTLREDVALCLEMAKEDAQASRSGEALAPLPPFFGVTPLMQAKGAPGFEWVARSRDIVVAIQRPNKSSRPKAQLTLSSECAWREGKGGEVAARAMEHYLRPFFEEDGYRVRVSRGDLATDFQGRDLEWADLACLVKRPRKVKDKSAYDGDMTWEGSGRLSGFYAGKSNAIRINFYDKTKEIEEVSGKTWFVDLWERHVGYAPGVRTNRNEFQFGREFLHEHYIETLDDFLQEMPRLWAHGMKWFSFRKPSETDSRRSRWEVADWWAVLSTWRQSDGEPLPKIKQVRPRFERVCPGLYGYVTSVMAITGAETEAQALDWALREMRAKKGEAGLAEMLAAKRQRYAGFTMADA
jgi:hypothetical protein